MANSSFEYTKLFETPDPIIKNTWIVVRIDGKNFKRLSEKHQFTKPWDERGLHLMNFCALQTFKEFSDIILAYGHSDEFRKETELYSRRASKILSSMASYFTSCFLFFWKNYFEDQKLLYPPSFDARVIPFPSKKNLRDYLSWRQVDCHINNLYNFCFWSLINKKNFSPQEAEKRLKGTFAKDKNELLFSECDINYNNIPEIFRKGTVLFPKFVKDEVNSKRRKEIQLMNIDIIKNEFWEINPELLKK